MSCHAMLGNAAIRNCRLLNEILRIRYRLPTIVADQGHHTSPYNNTGKCHFSSFLLEVEGKTLLLKTSHV